MIKYKVIEDCCDFEILKANLTEAELRTADELCEQHENATPNENGWYICGCRDGDKEGWGSEFCDVGLWLNSCFETDDFIKITRDHHLKWRYEIAPVRGTNTYNA